MKAEKLLKYPLQAPSVCLVTFQEFQMTWC